MGGSVLYNCHVILIKEYARHRRKLDACARVAIFANLAVKNNVMELVGETDSSEEKIKSWV